MHHSAAELNIPSSPERGETHKYTSKVDWEYQYCPDIGAHRAASALLVIVVTEPPDQFQFLAALLRMAQSLHADLATMVGLHYSLPPMRAFLH